MPGGQAVRLHHRGRDRLPAAGDDRIGGADGGRPTVVGTVEATTHEACAPALLVVLCVLPPHAAANTASAATHVDLAQCIRTACPIPRWKATQTRARILPVLACYCENAHGRLAMAQRDRAWR